MYLMLKQMYCCVCKYFQDILRYTCLIQNYVIIIIIIIVIKKSQLCKGGRK